MTQNNERELVNQLALECGLLLKTTNLDLCPSYLTKLEAFAKAYKAQNEQTKQIPDGWIEPQRVKVAIDEFRDLVINQRGLLAENGMTNDMVNDVLSEFDYYFHDIKCAVPPAPTNTEVGE